MSAKGNDALLRARQAFRLLRTTETLRKLDGGDLGPIYYWPVMSMDERRSVLSRLPLDTRTIADIDAAFVAAVLYRSRDELGNRLFDDESGEAALRDCDPELIKRIGAEMSAEPEPTIEGAEKN
jgi:hypothetical protein